MKDFYYRFADEQEALAALEQNGMTYVNDDGEVVASQGGHDFALWSVGSIEGVSGWHVNVRLVNVDFDVSSLEQYVVTPQNPRVVWA